jgi:cytosine/uracil/thiamine/allantoin permease
VNVNCLHITFIVTNEMPIFVAKCDFTVYCKMNEVIALKKCAMLPMPSLLLHFPIHTEDEI